jgi:superfamily II DNA or RNA helicase
MRAHVWRVGDRVRVRGGRWRIRGVTHAVNCSALVLHSEEAHRAGLTILLPFDRPVAIEPHHSPRAVRPRRWLHAVDKILLDAHPIDGLTSLTSSSIRLLPYQLTPALAVLAGTTRLLIADEVGLGKTIQAGIILHELASRDDGFRALVLAPAGLRQQWAGELDTHFGLRAIIADSAWLRHRASELPRDVNPWSLPGVYISSHDFVKRPEALRPLDELTWHVLVVDEAHLVTAGTDRRTAIHALASRSLQIVLLTATPHSGNRQAFASLCEMGRVTDDEPAMQVFARSKAEVGASTGRRSVVLAVAPSPAEREMHRLLDEYSAALWKEAAQRRDESARLASIVLRKRALSSPTSLVVSLARRLALLTETPRQEVRQLLLPLADEDPLEDAEPDSILGAPGLADAAREKRWLTAALEAASTATRHESKLRALRLLLRRVREPVIVFTEYRDTLAHLERSLASSGRTIAVLHGGMSPAERARVPSTFGSGADVLLATDAAAEGLNLHHHCRVVVHFELPWNAARLEQRAGRVDRLGQSRRPHDLALVSASTAERLVLAPLVARARSSRTGYRMLEHLSESRIADAILGGIALQVPARDERTDPEPSVSDRLQETAIREAERLCRQRALLARSRSERAASKKDASHDPVVTALEARRRCGAGARLVLIYLLSVDSEDGRRLHVEPFAIALRIPSSDWTRPAAVRAALNDSLRQFERPVAALLRETESAVRRRVGAVHEDFVRQLAVRQSAIARASRSAARSIAQPQLFARRGERHRENETPMFAEEAQSIGVHVESRFAAAILLDLPESWPAAGGNR